MPDDVRDRYVVTEFIRDEIADVYAMADLVVSRAGAGTIAELTALGKAAILIPLPLSGGGEQVTNAKALADRSAGVMLMQDCATPERLPPKLPDCSVTLNAGRDGDCGASMGRRDAAARLADELLALARYSAEPSLAPN